MGKGTRALYTLYPIALSLTHTAYPCILVSLYPVGSGKKLSTNPKAAEKRQQQAAASAAASTAAAKAKDDAYWDAHANPVNKRDVKKQAAAAAAEAAAAKKAELAALKRAEEAEMSKATNTTTKKKASSAAPKVTKREIDAHRMKMQEAYEAKGEEARMAARKEVGAEAYGALLEERVDNRAVVEGARSLDEAVRQMGGLQVGDGGGEVDRHPEKRAKAMFNAYFERRLPEMKEEKPGLKLMAYKSKIFDEWQKSPENPRNWRPS